MNLLLSLYAQREQTTRSSIHRASPSRRRFVIGIAKGVIAMYSWTREKINDGSGRIQHFDESFSSIILRTIQRWDSWLIPSILVPIVWPFRASSLNRCSFVDSFHQISKLFKKLSNCFLAALYQFKQQKLPACKPVLTPTSVSNMYSCASSLIKMQNPKL